MVFRRFGVISLIAMFVVLTAMGNFVPPKDYVTECALVSGESRFSYAQANSESSTLWNVSGPGYVKIYVRTEAGKNASVQLLIDGKEYKKYSISEKDSQKYKMEVGKSRRLNISQAKIIKIKIAKGKRNIELKSDGILYTRLVLVSQKPSALAPESYEKALSLINGDNKTTYYIGTAKKPIEIEYKGAGTLTVWSRLAFDKNMKGTQHYTVVAETVGDKKVRSKLESVISETSTWSNDGNVIPGKARTFKIKLKKGTNQIKLWSENTSGPYCAFRFSVKK
ncbi:hypothetical protein KAH81_04430 [bacterium]|nr:hypothetical protein [bacterium]